MENVNGEIEFMTLVTELIQSMNSVSHACTTGEGCTTAE